MTFEYREILKFENTTRSMKAFAEQTCVLTFVVHLHIHRQFVCNLTHEVLLCYYALLND